jgi:hypothetical protein
MVGRTLDHTAVILGFVWFAAGCTDGQEPEPKSYGDCYMRPASSPVAAEVVIGSGDAPSFQPFAHGADAELVLGTQGGYMIVPTVRIDALAFGPAGENSCIELQTRIGGAVVSSPSFSVHELTASEGHYYVERLPLFLSSELSGIEDERCSVTATLSTEGREATGEVEVVLVDEI